MMEALVNDILLSLLEKDKTQIDDTIQRQFAIVGNNTITVQRDNIIRLLEGVIGLFGTKKLGEEIMVLQTYLTQMKKAGYTNVSITMKTGEENELIIIVSGIGAGCDYMVFNLDEEELFAKIHSYISGCCQRAIESGGD